MSIFKRNTSEDDIEQLTKERDQLLKEIIPILQDQVRNNPSDGKIHIELVKGLAMGGKLDEAKVESDKAMLKFPVSERGEIWKLQEEIDKLISKRDLGY